MSRSRLLDSTSLAKKDLRRKISSVLETLSSKEVRNQSEIVANKVLSSDWFVSSGRVSIYLHTTNEIETDTLVNACFQQNKQVFVPQFIRGDSRMKMLHLPDRETYAKLPTTLWNIRQPSTSQEWEGYQQSGALDLVLFPGIAFTRQGDRLGHGKGFYDRFIAEHLELYGVKPLAVGLSLKQQIVDVLPTTDLDIKLDHVISP